MSNKKKVVENIENTRGYGMHRRLLYTCDWFYIPNSHFSTPSLPLLRYLVWRTWFVRIGDVGNTVPSFGLALGVEAGGWET